MWGETFLEPLESSPSLDAGKPLVLCIDKAFVAHGGPRSEEFRKDTVCGRASGWISRSAQLPRWWLGTIASPVDFGSLFASLSEGSMSLPILDL